MKKILVFMLALYVLPLIGISQNLPLSAGIPKYHLMTGDTEPKLSNSDSLFGVAMTNIPLYCQYISPNDSFKINQILKNSIALLDTLEYRGYHNKYVYSLNAQALQSLHKYYDAIQQIKIGLQYDTTFFIYYRIKAECKESLNDYYGAIQEYNNAISKEIKYKSGIWDLGYTYFERGRCKAGMGTLNNETNAPVMYEALADIDKAIDTYKEIGEEDALSLYIKGIILFSLHENTQALIVLSRAGDLGCQSAYKIIEEINSLSK